LRSTSHTKASQLGSVLRSSPSWYMPTTLHTPPPIGTRGAPRPGPPVRPPRRTLRPRPRGEDLLHEQHFLRSRRAPGGRPPRGLLARQAAGRHESEPPTAGERNGRIAADHPQSGRPPHPSAHHVPCAPR
jgi:hypothetical protein